MKTIGLIILLASFLWSCTVESGKGKGSESARLRTTTVKRGSITIELEEIGEIRPIREIEIKSKVSGKIVTFYVDEGDFIERGDLIADIEPDYNQAEQISRVRNNLDLAKIRLENRQKDLQDLEILFKDNFASRRQLDNARDALKEADINYQSALQQYDLIREIETEGNVSKLLSVASGTVIRKLVEEGEMVVSSVSSYSAGTIVLRIADLQRMIVKTNINEIDIGKVHIGQNVIIKVDAYPYHDYEGSITKIAVMATDFSNVKVFPIEIEILDVDEKLRPGMTANVTIIGEERKDILVIPIRAIFSDEIGQDIVYQVESDTIAKTLPIKTGINDFQQVEIIEGLEEDMEISLSEPARK